MRGMEEVRQRDGPGGGGATGNMSSWDPPPLQAQLCWTEAEAPRLSRSRWLAWVRGQLGQSQTVSSGLWEGLRSLADLSQPPGGWSTVRGGGQAAAKEQDPSSRTGFTSSINNSEHTAPTESHLILDSLPLFHLKYCSLKKNKAQGISSFNLSWHSQPALSRHPG